MICRNVVRAEEIYAKINQSSGCLNSNVAVVKKRANSRGNVSPSVWDNPVDIVYPTSRAHESVSVTRPTGRLILGISASITGPKEKVLTMTDYGNYV